ncbi:MAG TPA: TolC family protein [Cyclobacteriaceae bacterium]|nr:TolC family protein [Cyclobacteriaceae bacterium]
MIKRFLPAVFLWLAGGALFAQELLTFEKVIQLGLENNFDVNIAINEREIAANQKQMGLGAIMPVVDARYSRTASTEDVEQQFLNDASPRIIEDAKSQNETFSLVAIYGISADALIALKRLGKLTEISELEAKVVVENTVANLSFAYYRLVLELQRNRLLRETLELSQRRLDIARAQYELGQQSKSAYLAAQVDYNADLSLLVSQEQVIQTAKINLNELLAVPATYNYVVKDTILVEENLLLEDLIDNSLHHNKQLLVTQRQENLAFLQIRELQAQRLPTLTFNGNYNHSVQNSDAGFIIQNKRDGYNFGATIGINLFSGFTLNRRIQTAKLERVNQQYALEQYEVQLDADIHRTFNIYENSKKRLEIEQNNFNVVEENTEIAFERFKMGLTGFLEFRDAQVSRLEAENRLIDAIFSIKETEIELMRLSGKIFYQGNGEPVL